ncbi:MAG: hypothetical protein RR597_07525 [Christensenella sp.]
MYTGISTPELKELLDKYVEMFGEPLQLMEYGGNYMQLMKLLRQCILTETPYKSNMPSDVDI